MCLCKPCLLPYIDTHVHKELNPIALTGNYVWCKCNSLELCAYIGLWLMLSGKPIVGESARLGLQYYRLWAMFLCSKMFSCCWHCH